MKLRGTFTPRRPPSIGKAFYVREWRGMLIACKWPRRRQRVTHPTTLEQMEKFRQANWLTKFAPAKIQDTHRRLTKGTQLLPRDLMIAAMYGRGFTAAPDGHRRRYPVAAIKDLSETLDLLGSQPGDALARYPEGWRVSHPTQPGQVLMSKPAGEGPTWQSLAGGGGVWQQIEDVTLTIALGLGVYRQVVIPQPTQELDFTVLVPEHATGTRLAIRLNGIVSTSYAWSHQGMNAAGAGILTTSGAQTRWELTAANWLNVTGRTYATGRVFQGATGKPAFLAGKTQYTYNACIDVWGQINIGGTTVLTTIDFGSWSGVGLPIDTRIIVRAARPV